MNWFLRIAIATFIYLPVAIGITTTSAGFIIVGMVMAGEAILYQSDADA
jgi:hypothetical protein